LLAAMASLGSQIGQVVERRRAESRARAAGEHHQAIVDAALDCIITIDEDGRVLEFNPAAESTFGYSESEAVGRDMGELIVPPAPASWRPATRRAAGSSATSTTARSSGS